MGFYILSYLGIALFLLASGWRVYRQMTLPVHVRWELYPVQHECAAKAAYGGSYLEEPNWWEKRQERSLLPEILYMVPEILFIRGLRKENRPLWRVSFPFHFGLYLMIGAFVLTLVHASLTLWGMAAASFPLALLSGLIGLAAWGGAVLGTAGALGLLYRRWSDPALRAYATPLDYFNLLFIFVFFFSAFMHGLVSDPTWEGAKGYLLGLLTYGRPPIPYQPGGTFFGGVAIVTGSLLVAYIPLTHMSHMFMKYFLYHEVRWDDAPNRPGSRVESAVRRNLGLRPTWQAPHVGADGKKTWGDIAASGPKEQK